MPATTSTTIKGVSILTAKRGRKRGFFDLDVSPAGIEIRRPGRATQHLGWDRVSRWEIEERPDHVLLTLRGDGAVTPLVVRGWTLDDLTAVMQEVTVQAPGPSATPSATPSADSSAAPPDPPSAATPAPAPELAPAPTVHKPVEASEPVEATKRVTPGGDADPAHPDPDLEEHFAPTAASGSGRARRRPLWLAWKPAVTVVLLALAAAAVTVVLLQSAGVISWSFLGPTA
jgi:hypothetical protein